MEATQHRQYNAGKIGTDAGAANVMLTYFSTNSRTRDSTLIQPRETLTSSGVGEYRKNNENTEKDHMEAKERRDTTNKQIKGF